MTTINDILEFFEGFAPIESAMDFDNVGLLAGDKNAVVSSALVSLDITADVVNEAQNLGCELIISHHPVIFSPIKRLTADSVPYLLASRGISAICMHTNLDLSESFGVNTCLANALGVKNVTKSKIGECLFVGELDEETDMSDFAKNTKSALDCNGLRYTEVKNSVKRIAVSSGSGGCEIFAAAKEGADVLVTGEIKHHEINTANSLGVNIVDAGHFKSEDVVILPLIKRLSDAFSGVKFTKSKVYSDMVKFL